MEYKINHEKFYKVLFKILLFLSAIMFGVLVGVIYSIHEDESTILMILTFIVVMLIELYFSVIIHEFGHFIFGLIDGFKFHYFQIGILRLYRNKDGKLKLKTIKTPIMGQCIMKPNKENKDIKYSLYMYGGSILNLTFFILPLIFFIILVITKNYLCYSLGTLSIVNFYLFINNGLPLTIGFIDNDCKNLILMNKYEDIRNTIINSLELQYYQDIDAIVDEMPEGLVDNYGITFENLYFGYVPFMLIKAFDKIVKDEEECYSNIIKLFYERKKLPLLYKESVVELTLFYYLITDREYRGIMADNENSFIFKHPDKKNPLLMISFGLIDYKENKIDLDGFKNRIEDLKTKINKDDYIRIEKDLFYKLFDEAILYIESKESLKNEDNSDIEQVPSEEVLQG